ncbi:glycosyltransferase [Azospirillum formosense]|uniref:glycosyltransferase n=1 Tax=Azospirillum formosense TaxID=861533 RepID=UPI00157B8665
MVLDNAAPEPEVLAKVKIIRLAEYETRWNDFAGVPHLYHLGNNPDHVYLFPIAMRRPGVVVLHDASLHYLVDCQTLRWGDIDGYVEALTREYGYSGALLAEQFRNHGWRETSMFYALPMNRSILARSRSVIVHSRYAMGKALAQVPEADVVSIPHHIAPAALANDHVPQADARRRIGADQDELLLISLGFVTGAKRIDCILRSLARLRGKLPPFRYIIAGAAQPDQYDVQADIRRLGLEDRVTVTGYLSESLFFDYVAAADVVLNLRYPTGGETSGTLIRALGTGACTVVVDHGPFAEIPDGAAVKLAWGSDFEERLERSLLELAHAPDQRRQIGEAARAYIRDAHAIQRSAAAYRDVILAAQNKPEEPWAVSAAWEFATPSSHEAALSRLGVVKVQPGDLWWRQAAVPVKSDPIQVVTCLPHAASTQYMADLFGHIRETVQNVHRAQLIKALTQRYRRSCDLLLVAQPIEAVDRFWDLLVQANRALSFGGLLVLDLWQDDKDNTPPELAHPEDIDALLLRAGFRLRRRWIGPDDVSFALDLADPEGWQREPHAEGCWQAVKISEFIAPPDHWSHNKVAKLSQRVITDRADASLSSVEA